ncbi:hypothetical protein HDU96_010505 [Phlyctochytrium bullatum]|nr:hypothetical protein HDU96_010505 [Phlyctochytrium bullatum]
MRVLRIVGTTAIVLLGDLLALTAFVSGQASTATDPCQALSTALGSSIGAARPYATLEQVYACYNSFPADATFRSSHVSELKKLIDVYSMADLYVATPRELLTPGIQANLAEALDTLATASTTATQFQFTSQIRQSLLSLLDGHFRDFEDDFDVVQKEHFLIDELEVHHLDCQEGPSRRSRVGQQHANKLYSIYINQIYLIADNAVNCAGEGARRYHHGNRAPQWIAALAAAPGAPTSLQSLTGYTVKSIDGVDAVLSIFSSVSKTAIQGIADKFSGFSRSPESRFNSVLYRKVYVNSSFTDTLGKAYFTDFLGADATPSRTYVLSPPTGTTSAASADITVVMPWLASAKPPERYGGIDVAAGWTTGETFYAANCRSSSTSSSAATIRSSSNRVDRSGTNALVDGSHTPLPADLSQAQTLADALVANAFSTSKPAQRAPAEGTATTAALDLTRPVISDDNMAFYILDDGVTGVWVLSTFAPPGSYPSSVVSFLATATAGLRALEKGGAKRLVIDVVGNGGGYFCVATALAEYLFPNTAMIVDQVRLTPAVSALFKIDFLDFKSGDAVGLNSTDVTDASATITKNRGGGDQVFSGQFRLCQSPASKEEFAKLTPLTTGWKAQDVAIVSDGSCGSSCACMVRTLRDAQGIKSFSYGGSTNAAPFTPTSFEGGVVLSFAKLAELSTATDLTTTDQSLLPTGFSSLAVDGQLAVTQGFSLLGRFGLEYPAEFVAQPAETQLTVAQPWDKPALWKAVVANMPAVDGQTDPGTDTTSTTTDTEESTTTGTTVVVTRTVTTKDGNIMNGADSHAVNSFVVGAAGIAALALVL